MRPVLEAIAAHVPPPEVRPDEPLRLLISTLDYSDYVGRIGIGRISAGRITAGSEVAIVTAQGKTVKRRLLELHAFTGLGREKVESLPAGEIAALVGLDPIFIGDTVSDPESPGALPSIPVDEPTLHMTFRVNNGPFAGLDGKYVTSRQIRERLDRELLRNVALRVEPGEDRAEFHVSGRGLLHLGILLENMRREGFEVCVGKPRVITRRIDGKIHEPIELMVIDCPDDAQSSVMSLIGNRRAELRRMDAKPGATGYVHMEFTIPARGLIGLRSRMMTATQGRAIMHHSFLGYGPWRGPVPHRTAGVMVCTDQGQITAYALDNLADRGSFFVRPGDKVYAGQVVGEHNRDNDIDVNAVRMKKLTNVRAAGKDDSDRARPIRDMTLERALEYISEDELVEITPHHIRMRKRLLDASERKRFSRRAVKEAERSVDVDGA